MPLTIDIRSGGTLLINGALIRFNESAQVSLLNRVDFVYSRQYMGPEQAGQSRLHGLYYAVQQCYAGGEEPTQELSNWLADGWIGEEAVDEIAAWHAAMADRWHECLKHLAKAIGQQWEWRRGASAKQDQEGK